MPHCEFDHSLYFPGSGVAIHHLCDMGGLTEEEANKVPLLGELNEVLKMGLVVRIGLDV